MNISWNFNESFFDQTTLFLSSWTRELVWEVVGFADFPKIYEDSKKIPRSRNSFTKRHLLKTHQNVVTYHRSIRKANSLSRAFGIFTTIIRFNIDT
jgi:hypothetical protein